MTKRTETDGNKAGSISPNPAASDFALPQSHGNTLSDTPIPPEATRLLKGDRLLTLKEALQIARIGKTAWYESVAKGEAPRGIKIGQRKTLYLESEVIAWVNIKITARNNKYSRTRGDNV